jgi:hypothetical protein
MVWITYTWSLLDGSVNGDGKTHRMPDNVLGYNLTYGSRKNGKSVHRIHLRLRHPKITAFTPTRILQLLTSCINYDDNDDGEKYGSNGVGDSRKNEPYLHEEITAKKERNAAIFSFRIYDSEDDDQKSLSEKTAFP